MQSEGEEGKVVALHSHARTPDALEDVLVTLRGHLHGRLFCVLVDAGSRRGELARVGHALADRLIETTRSRRSQAIREALRLAGPGDIVLIAGAARDGWLQRGEAEVRSLMEEAA